MAKIMKVLVQRDCAICTGLTKAMFQKDVEGDDYQVELRGSVTTSVLVLL
jgi:hypothetical protein